MLALLVAWLKAVAFHGTFDVLALLVSLLIVLEVLPAWSEFAAIAVQVVLALLLVVLCRRALRELWDEDGYLSVPADTV